MEEVSNNGYYRYYLHRKETKIEEKCYVGRKYVEIGGIKWATMNVGAEKPTDRGLYFAWGETKGYTAEQVRNGEREFIWKEYKCGDVSPYKYNDIDEKMVLDSCDDAVTMNWGKGWRMPTKEEFEILFENTTDKWVENYQGSGVSGRLFTDKKDRSKVLFFPATGHCSYGSIGGQGKYGNYWSSSLDSDNGDNALYLFFGNGDAYWDNCCSRYYGFAIRGVVAE